MSDHFDNDATQLDLAGGPQADGLSILGIFLFSHSEGPESIGTSS